MKEVRWCRCGGWNEREMLLLVLRKEKGDDGDVYYGVERSPVEVFLDWESVR